MAHGVLTLVKIILKSPNDQFTTSFLGISHWIDATDEELDRFEEVSL